jgi:hypothetical protein
VLFGSLRFLLERVKHANPFLQRREIDDPERAGRLANPNFPHAGADAWHRLPIVGIAPHLDSPTLMSGFVPRILWKIPDGAFCIADPGKWFHILYRF